MIKTKDGEGPHRGRDEGLAGVLCSPGQLTGLFVVVEVLRRN